jgi:hypothetical protein
LFGQQSFPTLVRPIVYSSTHQPFKEVAVKEVDNNGRESAINRALDDITYPG